MSQNRHEQAPKEYVVGYCFSPDLSRVALIEKQKPAWQHMKLNGVGGKIEPTDACPADAMAREFHEEAGVLLRGWQLIRVEKFRAAQEAARDQAVGARVYHFVNNTTRAEWSQIRTQERERIVKVSYPLRPQIERRCIYNLPYLIPMAWILMQQPSSNLPQP